MNKLLSTALITLQLLVFANLAHANTKAKAMNEVQQDIVSPIQMAGNNRLCLDGSKPDGKVKIDYWVDFECPYCRVQDIVEFQRENKDACIIIRHTPSIGQGSMPKALTYEALLQINANAANNFWKDVYPQGGISKPYQLPVMNALNSLVMTPEQFKPHIDKVKSTIERDNQYSTTILSYTPTFVIEGIRFTACDFTASQLEKVIPIAKAARKGDKEAQAKIVQIIDNGLNNKTLL